MEVNPYQAPQQVSAGPARVRRLSFARWGRLLLIAAGIAAAILAGYKVIEVLFLSL
jgi:hypothetical protein